MDVKSCINLERLLEQIIALNPKVRESPDQLHLLNKKLEDQLVQGEAVVRVVKMETALLSSFDQFADNIEKRIHQLKNMLNTSKNHEGGNRNYCSNGIRKSYEERAIKIEEFQSDSSDDEALIFKQFRNRASQESSSVQTVSQSEDNFFLNGDSSVADAMDYVPLSLRRTPRKRKRSSNFKYDGLSPIKPGRCSRVEHNNNRSTNYKRQDVAVSTSGVIHPCEEDIIVEQGVTSRSFHIKIPSLFKNAVHELNFCDLEISRKLFDARAQEAKRKLLQNENKSATSSSQNKKKSHKKKALMPIDEFANKKHQQEKDDAVISQLINDVIGTSGNEEETWQATYALESINNQLIDNYNVLPGYISPPPELVNFEKRKAPKRRNDKSSTTNTNEEPKKRGRKPKTTNNGPVPQPPIKSNLAQYVENFSNDCDTRGSTTPAASSTMSQPLVSSTTQNFEFIDQQHARPVMCYFDGNWANGGPCQLITANGVPLDAAQIQTTDPGFSDPFQETDLNGNISLPIITQFRQFQQTTSLQNAVVSPVINIQIPALPIETTTVACNTAPPPAHTTPGVLDLSLKSNLNVSNTSIEALRYNMQQDMSVEYAEMTIEEYDNEAIPLDLSANAVPSHNVSIESVLQHNRNDLSESQCILVDNGQDDDFIRCLIETSDFDLGLDELQGKKDNNKSFKTALDMPLLDTAEEDHNGILNDSTAALPNDSSYASNNDDSTNYLSCTFGEDYQFVDQSTKEIFHQLLDIDSTTVSNNNNRTNEENIGKISDVCLNEATILSNTSTQVEQDNTSNKNDKNKEDNSDTATQKTVTPISTENTDDNTNKNRMAVMKWVPRILKRRHAGLSVSVDEPLKNKFCNANDVIEMDSFASLKSLTKNDQSNCKDAPNVISSSQCEEMTNENIIILSDPKDISDNVSDEVPSTNKLGVPLNGTQKLIKKEECGGKHNCDEAKDLENTRKLEEAKEDLYKAEDIEKTPDIDETKVLDKSKDIYVAKVLDEVRVLELNDVEDNMDMRESTEVDQASGECLTSAHTTTLDRVTEDILIAEQGDEANDSGEANKNDDADGLGSLQMKKKVSSTNDVSEIDATFDLSTAVEISQETTRLNYNANSEDASYLIKAKEIDEGDDRVEAKFLVGPKMTNKEPNLTRFVDMKDLEKCNILTDHQITDHCAPLNSKSSTSAYSGTLHSFKNDDQLQVLDGNLSKGDSSFISNDDNKQLQDKSLPQNTKTPDFQNFKINAVKSPTKCVVEDENTAPPSSIVQQEKVVFSIAKIDLIEESHSLDYLFLSDSDNSSRKSCDDILQFNTDSTMDGTELQLQSATLRIKTTPVELGKEEEEEVVFPPLLFSGSVDGDEIHEVDNTEFDNTQPDCNDSNHNIISIETAEDSNGQLIASDANLIINKEGGVKSPAVFVGGKSEDNVKKDNEINVEYQNKTNEGNEIRNSEDVTKSMYPELTMSLLEMESKLDENTLNYEDDDDLDALILDTSSSCFDSPNEDRFKDSCVSECSDQNNNLTSTAEQINVQIDVPRQLSNADSIINVEVPKFPSIDSIIKTRPSAACGLMSFKIPKLKTKSSDKQINEDTRTKSPITCANVPNIYDIKMQPYVKLERIAVKEGCRINIKDYKETTKASGGTINKNSKKYENITRTIKNDPKTTSGEGIPPNFKSSFKNITNIANNEKHLSITARSNAGLSGAGSLSERGIQQTRQQPTPTLYVPLQQPTPLKINPNFKCTFKNITTVSKLNPTPSGLANTEGMQQPQQQHQTPFQNQINFKCTLKNISAVVSTEQLQSINAKSQPGPSGGIGSAIRQTCVKNGIHEIAYIFGVTCLPHLVNACLEPTHCQKCHQYNGNDVVFSTLNTLNKNQLYVAYSFMYSHSKLFGRYFGVFCNLFVIRNNRDKLLNMVNDCERYPEHAEFLKVLYDSLVRVGLSPSIACRELLKRTREKSTPVIDALVAIIMKSDWTMFSDYIESYTQDIYKYNFRMGVLEQMAPAVLNSSRQQVDLKNIFFKCVQTLHCDDVPSLCACSPILMQCLALMATSGNTQR